MAQNSMSFDFRIATIERNDYRINISFMTKCNVTNKMVSFVLNEEKCSTMMWNYYSDGK